MTRQTAWWVLGPAFALALAGCDQIKERAGIVDPAKVEAEGKAIGSACRHAGWGIEDCFRLNPDASKPAMFAGWKDMNEYMLKNEMQALPPTIPPDGLPPSVAPKKKKKVIDLEPIDKVDKPVEDKPGEKTGEGGKAEAGQDKKAAAH